MTTARNFIGEAIRACNSRNLHVKVIAFDGQFLELAVSDASGMQIHESTMGKGMQDAKK